MSLVETSSSSKQAKSTSNLAQVEEFSRGVATVRSYRRRIKFWDIQKSSEALRSIQALLLVRTRARKRPRTLRSFQDENTSLPISSIGQSSGLISSTVQNCSSYTSCSKATAESRESLLNFANIQGLRPHNQQIIYANEGPWLTANSFSLQTQQFAHWCRDKSWHPWKPIDCNLGMENQKLKDQPGNFTLVP